MAVAASFGLACALSVVVLGDESGYVASENQKMKIAAIEAEWHTEPAPAGFTVFGIPDVEAHRTHAEVKMPWLLGLIATRSVDQPVPGIFELVARARERVSSGIEAYAALQTLRADPGNAAAARTLRGSIRAISATGCCCCDTDDPLRAAPAADRGGRLVHRARTCRCSSGASASWWGSGSTSSCCSRSPSTSRPGIASSGTAGFCRLAFCSLPLPWIAAELGWIVAEYGRQPWAVDGLLPTFLGVSVTPVSNVWFSLAGFVIFYSALAVVDVYLMVRTVRRGPDGLGYWPPRRTPRAEAHGSARSPYAMSHASSLGVIVPDYETLRVIWWLILGVLLVGFALTDGFDLGVGAIFRFIGRTDEERRALLESIEPVWEGNQVWFILAGGAVFAAWPLPVRGLVLGAVPRDVPAAARADPAPGGFQFPQQAAPTRAGASCWDWALCRRRARCRRCCSASPSAISSSAFPSISTRCSDRCTAVASSVCCIHSRCSPGS